MNIPALTNKRTQSFFGSAVAIVVLSSILIGVARSDNAEDPPDSIFTAQGPIADQQTIDASIASKQEGEQLYEQERQAALDAPLGSKDPSQHPPRISPPTQPTRVGIFEQGPLPAGWASTYQITNRWHNFVNGISIVVYAGSVADDPMYTTWNDPQQGVVILKTTPSDPNVNPSFDTYATASRTGAVSVISYSGTCLILRSTGNSLYSFDVVTRQWACNATDNPVP